MTLSAGWYNSYARGDDGRSVVSKRPGCAIVVSDRFHTGDYEKGRYCSGFRPERQRPPEATCQGNFKPNVAGLPLSLQVQRAATAGSFGSRLFEDGERLVA